VCLELVDVDVLYVVEVLDGIYQSCNGSHNS